MQTEVETRIKHVDVVQSTADAKEPAKPVVPFWACAVPGLATSLLFGLCFQPVGWGLLGWIAFVPFFLLTRSTARPRRLYFWAYVSGAAFFFPMISWMPVADQWMLGDHNIVSALFAGRMLPMHGAWVMLCTYCAFYFPVALLLIRWLDRSTRLPLVLTAPIVWVGLEYIRSFALTGFAWYYMGHTQHDWLAAIQIADLGGAYAVSFVVAAVNAWSADALMQRAGIRSIFRLSGPRPGQEFPSLSLLNYEWMYVGDWRKNLVFEAIGVVFLLVATFGYGVYRLENSAFRDGPVVSLLQGNLDQRLRNEATPIDSDDQARHQNQRKVLDEIAGHYTHLVERAIFQQPKPRLLIWPETSYPYAWFEVSRDIPLKDVPQDWRDMEGNLRPHFGKLGLFSRTYNLLGVNAQVLHGDGVKRNHNSALLVTPDGAVEKRHDKMHRIPFGEFVPFRDWLPFMNALSPYDFDYSIQPGKTFTRFEVDSFRFGVLVCYEDTDPDLARQYGRTCPDGAPVDFLVNISNDGWFDGSSEHVEHLAISRFRAIENRRAIVRSVNMGVSAVIDSNGMVRKPTKVAGAQKPQEPARRDVGSNAAPIDLWAVFNENGQGMSAWPVREWRDLVKTRAVLTAIVPIDDRVSVYALAGDWLPWLCWATLLVCLVYPSLSKRMRRANVGPASPAVPGSPNATPTRQSS